MSNIEADNPSYSLFINSKELTFNDDGELPISVSSRCRQFSIRRAILRRRRTSTTTTTTSSSTRPRLSMSNQGETVEVAVKNVHDFTGEEIKKLVSLEHRNIVRFIGAIKEDVVNAIVMEFVTGGNLYEYIARNREQKKCIGLRLCFNLTLQCARGLEYLHGKNIIHKNVQSYNCLLSSTTNILNCILKLSNFGFKKQHPYAIDLTTFHESRKAWQAPEVIDNTEFFRKASDVYSIGIIVWEMLTCQRPWNGKTDHEIYENVVKRSEHLKIEDEWPCQLQKLLKDCWKTERAQRPIISDICCRVEVENEYQNTPIDLDRPLRMIEIPKIASHLKPKSHWKEFAVNNLGICESECDALKKEGTDDQDQLICDVLRKWLMREGKNGTVGTLAEHLKHSRLFDVSGYKFLCGLKQP
ncbi:uncharacterized protein [Antedon mediterranea]|uniref:uncharacterized protein n=1 Tax=Antedon mediterranea TaxID=105859 RepID=UPI003AF9CA17